MHSLEPVPTGTFSLHGPRTNGFSYKPSHDRVSAVWKFACKTTSPIHLSSWFFAAAMANLRPQNYPFPQFTANFITFHEKSVFTLLKPNGFFLSVKVPKVSIPGVLKLPVCLKLLYRSSLFLNCSYYQPLHYTYRSSFSFTRLTICDLCRLFCFCFRCRCSRLDS